MNLFADPVAPELLPNFICIGAEKCGSTLLYDYLRSHPDVYMSPIKETNFFSTDVRAANFRDDYRKHELRIQQALQGYFEASKLTDLWGAYLVEPGQYLRLFEGGKDFKARGEVCNSYLYSAEAVQNMRDSLGDPKLIITLRDPVNRAWSQYRAMVRDGRTTKENLIDEISYDLSFSDRRWGSCHGYIDHGMYSKQLERLFAVFPQEQVKVVMSDELFHDTDRVMQQLFEFLGIPASDAYVEANNRNRSVSPRNEKLIRLISRGGFKARANKWVPDFLKQSVRQMLFKDSRTQMTQAERDFLVPFFVDDVKKVEAILGKDLGDWLV